MVVESQLDITQRPKSSQRASQRTRLDTAAARRRSGRLAPEHQFDRARALRAEPATGAHFRAGFRVFDRADLHAGDQEMKIPILGIEIDERFLEHRRRSTSFATIVGAIVAVGLYWYRYFIDGVVAWELLVVLLAMVVAKLGLMIWYYLT